MQEELALPSVGGRVEQGRPGRWVDAVPALGPHLETVVFLSAPSNHTQR